MSGRTVGGVISGYWATGKMKTAMLPISTMITEITAAKIGRLMKNLATCFTVRARRCAAASPVARPRAASEWAPRA